MRAVTRAIYHRLASDTDLTGALPVFQGRPSIFAERSVPAQAPLPYVHIRPVISQAPWNTLDREGWEVGRDIVVYDTDRGSEGPVDDLAEQVRLALHNRPLVIEGWHNATITATGPADAPEEPGFTGRIVSLLIRIQRA